MAVIDIIDELSQNFIDFAYEANSERAFPDVRDGLKPGQRACLWEFYNKGYTSNKPHVKSAKVSGGVIASWWPHGDAAIYDTFTRMSQPWINNIPEVSWHGNNGNQIIGPTAASSRYTEARLSKAIEDGMFVNIKKKVVPMQLNFSEDDYWPEVLPSIFPRLMINGSQGIGVTIAQTFLPMNLNELTDVIRRYITTEEIDYSKLAPDFPSGGIIINKDNLADIYRTGKGKAIVRAKTEIKDKSIFITELPYQVYVEPLIDEIKALIEKNEISGIDDIYNKSDKKNLLIEIECSGNPHTILFQLFKSTSLQKNYNANQWALIGKTPKLINLKEYIDIYLAHNIKCLCNGYKYDLQKAQERKEIVDGLLKALVHIDEIITLIKKSESSATARKSLIEMYGFTERQAKAITDMRLGSLARLEAIELEKEGRELENTINTCQSILADTSLQKTLVIKNLEDFTNKYGFERRTELTQIEEPKNNEEKKIAAIPPEKCVVVLTGGGNIKRIPATSFRSQRRNGKGIKTQDDITQMVLRTNTVDSLMIFTNQGNMYRLIVDDIPEGTNSSKGTPVRALIQMEAQEEPTIIYSIYRETDDKFIVFVTKQGYVKRTALSEYTSIRKKNGTKALSFHEGDELRSAFLTNQENIIIFTKQGYGLRVKGSDFTPSGRVTMGIKGINLRPEDEVVTALPVRDETDDVAVFTRHGMGRRFELKTLPAQTRNTRGNICAKNEEIVAACMVSDDDMVLVCGNKNSLCIKANEICKVVNKTSVGTIIIKDNQIVSATKV